VGVVRRGRARLHAQLAQNVGDVDLDGAETHE
jgi:hypothetical protein